MDERLHLKYRNTAVGVCRLMPLGLRHCMRRVVMRLLWAAIGLFLAILPTLSVFAEEGRLYDSKRLSSTAINCMAQDSCGYLWIGTNYGLSRFDGYDFVNYLKSAGNTPSICDNRINVLHCGTDGRLWIGTAHGLMIFDHAVGKFRLCRFPKGLQPRIKNILEDAEGNILTDTKELGVCVVERGKEKAVPLSKQGKSTSLRDYGIVYTDQSGQLWLSRHEDKLIFMPSYGRAQGNFPAVRLSSGPPVAYFGIGKQHVLIVCRHGLELFNKADHRLRVIHCGVSSYLSDAEIISAAMDRMGNLYFGTSGIGVLKVAKGWQNVSQLHVITKQHLSLSDANVTALLLDKNQNLWISCYSKGLLLVGADHQPFRSWSLSDQGYSVGSSVMSIVQGANHTVWCLAGNAGVFEFNRDGEVKRHLSVPRGATQLYRDSRNQYWLATHSAVYRRLPGADGWSRALTCQNKGIYVMTDDGRGNLYFAVSGKGFMVYNAASGKTEHYAQSTTPKGQVALCNDQVQSMCFDQNGLLWIGTSDGLCCFDPVKKRFGVLGWHRLLPNKMVEGICEDVNGDMIIGTGNGLYVYSRQSKRVQEFPNSAALREIPICGIVRDKDNDLWISTKDGIWQYARHLRKFICYRNGNGLAEHEYAHGAQLCSADGMLAFGTADGVTTFYPRQVNLNQTPLGDVYLTNLIIDGQSKATIDDDIQLDYDQNTVSMRFSLLNYNWTDNIRFEYCIDGGKWQTTAQGDNEITLLQLRPGTYDIAVRGVYGESSYSKTRRLTITVRHPWYASTWAWLIYALMAAVLAVLFIRHLHRRQAEKIRKYSLRALIDATHDIRSPLTLIISSIRKLRQKDNDPESQSYLDTIDRNANRLMLLVNEILDARKLSHHRLSLSCQETHIASYLRSIGSLFQSNAVSRNIQLNLPTGHDELTVWIDRVNFGKVITNLLGNAFKYTPDGGSIDLTLATDEKNLILSVIDTGPGIPEHDTGHLFDRYYQADEPSRHHYGGTGIGLSVCKAIVELHGGSIKAGNRADRKQGACFTLTLPLGKRHLKSSQIMGAETMTDNVEPTSKNHNKNAKILIVDDDPEITEYIRKELHRWYRIDTAPNGKVAMQMILSNDYDLVASDVMMPEMDGIEMLKQIKGNPRTLDLPVIIFSSQSEVGDRMEGYKMGADAYLPKPFSMDELHALIDSQIASVRRLRGKFSGAQEQKGTVREVGLQGNDETLMANIMKSVNRHLGDSRFSVELLCDEVGMSRTHLNRKMKELVGLSPTDFIRNLRLEQAAKLLVKGDLNIMQIAYAVGFGTASHFTAVFKKYYGVTPKEYVERQGHKQGS